MEVGRAFLGSGCHEGSQNEHLQTKAEETGFCPLASVLMKQLIMQGKGIRVILDFFFSHTSLKSVGESNGLISFLMFLLHILLQP